MLHDASGFYAAWPATMNATKGRAPDLGKAFGPFFQTLMKDGGEGGLSVKVKELIALGIGVAVRCEPCIYSHVEKCLKAGATPKEVMEAVGVSVMMGGGPVYTYASVVAGALEHFERNPVAPHGG
ncbi:MAG TPA: carboxymuconolactone decarboxylase family protein [Phycisphaerales bacterium]|nr:carboxymuconolactone decarboxylase family protein [Phycisphaerales bacterium]